MGIIIIACGIIIYFIFREWVRQCNRSKLPLDRLTAEQIVELHRLEVEARFGKRNTTDFKIWSLRVAVPLLCGSLMFMVGMLILQDGMLSDRYSKMYRFFDALTVILPVIGMSAGALIEFVVELWLERKIMRDQQIDN